MEWTLQFRDKTDRRKDLINSKVFRRTFWSSKSSDVNVAPIIPELNFGRKSQVLSEGVFLVPLNTTRRALNYKNSLMKLIYSSQQMEKKQKFIQIFRKSYVLQISDRIIWCTVWPKTLLLMAFQYQKEPLLLHKFPYLQWMKG